MVNNLKFYRIYKILQFINVFYNIKYKLKIATKKDFNSLTANPIQNGAFIRLYKGL